MLLHSEVYFYKYAITSILLDRLHKLKGIDRLIRVGYPIPQLPQSFQIPQYRF